MQSSEGRVERLRWECQYLVLWLEWLRNRLPVQRSVWEARIASKQLPIARGMMPGSPVVPSIVYVLPAPVCP